MRALHLADVHLDTPFAGRSERLRRRLRSASRAALSAAVDCALAERVHVVLIAGDLFDGERLSLGTELFLLDELARLSEAEIRVVYATGNHDWGRSRRPREVAWPPNVTVVDTPDPRRIPIEARDGQLLGFVTAAGHASARETADLSSAFQPPPGELPEIAVLHSQVVGATGGEEHEPYAPSELRRLRDSGFHYWALGHVHVRQQLSGDPEIHYPGNLQGRTPAERGPKGGLLVDLTAPDAPKVEFQAFAPLRFETLEVSGLGGEESLTGMITRVVRAWETERRQDGWSGRSQDWIVRVVLSGPTPFWRELAEEEERSALAVELGERLGALDVDVWARGTHPVLSPEDHRGRQDVLGEALRLLEDVRSGRATIPGLDPAELAGSPGEPRELDEYVRELLAGAEGEILARLLDFETA